MTTDPEPDYFAEWVAKLLNRAFAAGNILRGSPQNTAQHRNCVSHLGLC